MTYVRYLSASMMIGLVLGCSMLVLVGCDKPGDDGQPAQSKRKGDLTRELAAEILNEYLAKPSISELEFKKGGIDRALSEGVLVKELWNDGVFQHTRCRFTDKGLKMIGSFLAPGSDKIEMEAFGATAFGDSSPMLHLKSPIGETVSAVTGITMDPVPTVEFTTAYALPAEMEPMTRYVFSGLNTRAKFRKYDDGWRVLSVDR